MWIFRLEEEKHKQSVGKAKPSGSAWDLQESLLSTSTEKTHTGSEVFRPIEITLKSLIQPSLDLYLNWIWKTETCQGSHRGSPCSIWGTYSREGCCCWCTLLHPQYHLLVHWRSWSAEHKGADTLWQEGRKPLIHHSQHPHCPMSGVAVVTSFQEHCYCTQLLP